MLYSNTLIQKNYLESLKNQSRYLANQSEKVLADEDRLEAMQLALFALPDGEGDERPVTPEAIKAITQASLAYQSLEGSSIAPVWNYRMPNHVSDMKITSDGRYFVAKDAGNVRGANMVLLGMAAPFIEIITVEQLRKAISVIFARKGEAIVEANLKAFDMGVAASNK